MIMLMGVLKIIFYLGGMEMGILLTGVMSFLVASFVVLCCGGLPRFRYDLLKYFLSVILVNLVLLVMFLVGLLEFFIG